MTSRVFVNGVELVNVGNDRCSACDRLAVGRSINGHLVCARHAGWAAQFADELAQEVGASRVRTATARAATLARCRRLVAAVESVRGDDRRRANGQRNARGKARHKSGIDSGKRHHSLTADA